MGSTRKNPATPSLAVPADGASAEAADSYWEHAEQSYARYPTVRHRIRFIVEALRRHGIGPGHSVFDYGCGEGTLLRTLKERLGIPSARLGGCDISRNAVEIARAKTGSTQLYAQSPPRIDARFDALVCCEVIEHTPRYRELLQWMRDHLEEEGLLVLTTQSGRIHASDRYTGHTQHFVLAELVQVLRELGLEPLRAREWGFPLFTLQKYATNLAFGEIRERYLEGTMTLRKRVVFGLSYAAYFVHDLLPLGPQIFIVARKRSAPGAA